MTRAEHMAWRKQRAHDEWRHAKANGKNWSGAIASMLSDLAKHPETEKLTETCAMLMFTVKDEASLFRFIDGFH